MQQSCTAIKQRNEERRIIHQCNQLVGGGGDLGACWRGKLIVRTKDETGASEIQGKHCQKQGMSTCISGHTDC